MVILYDIRMWEFHLAYCEGGYLERALGNVHMLLAKPRYRGWPLDSIDGQC